MLHLVTLDFPPATVGGVAAWAEDLARALVGAGERVTVYARRCGDTLAHDATLPFDVVRLRGRSWARWQGLWAVLGVDGALRRGHRLVCASWPMGVHLVPRARAKGVRAAVAFHGSDLTRVSQPSAAMRRVFATADALFPVSAFLRGELERLGATGQVLPMPLALDDEAAASGRGLVTVARLTPLKGVDRALRIAGELGWPIEVVGEGPERASLEALARTLGVEASFCGQVPRSRAVQLCRGKAACLLLPRAEADGSGAEGFGLALLEAMGQGTPAVGCRTGGVPEATGPGLILENPDDAPASAAAVRAWWSPERGAAGHRWVRAHHGPERAAHAVLEALS